MHNTGHLCEQPPSPKKQTNVEIVIEMTAEKVASYNPEKKEDESEW